MPSTPARFKEVQGIGAVDGTAGGVLCPVGLGFGRTVLQAHSQHKTLIRSQHSACMPFFVCGACKLAQLGSKAALTL